MTTAIPFKLMIFQGSLWRMWNCRRRSRRRSIWQKTLNPNRIPCWITLAVDSDGSGRRGSHHAGSRYHAVCSGNCMGCFDTLYCRIISNYTTYDRNGLRIDVCKNRCDWFTNDLWLFNSRTDTCSNVVLQRFIFCWIFNFSFAVGRSNGTKDALVKAWVGIKKVRQKEEIRE